MRFTPAAPLLLLAALAAVPAGAQVAGHYEMASINGHALPTPSPTEEGVTVLESTFWFEEDGSFWMSMTGSTSQGEASAEGAGTYLVLHDTLRLTGQAGGPVIEFRWARRGDTLQLYDNDDNVYGLVPDVPTASARPRTPGAGEAVERTAGALSAPRRRDGDVTVARLATAFAAGGRGTAGAAP